jgi:hypothetical protein
MGFQNETEGFGIQDAAVLVSLPLLDENSAGVEADLFYGDAREFRNAVGGVEEEPEHDLVPEIADLPDGV